MYNKQDVIYAFTILIGYRLTTTSTPLRRPNYKYHRTNWKCRTTSKHRTIPKIPNYMKERTKLFIYRRSRLTVIRRLNLETHKEGVNFGKDLKRTVGSGKSKGWIGVFILALYIALLHSSRCSPNSFQEDFKKKNNRGYFQLGQDSSALPSSLHLSGYWFGSSSSSIKKKSHLIFGQASIEQRRLVKQVAMLVITDSYSHLFFTSHILCATNITYFALIRRFFTEIMLQPSTTPIDWVKGNDGINILDV
ncbi:unnamed protein product [Lactuca saligna]|uniref:Transmembrane protein n=1 Tax=Lactuca saligna TaxID=75948 RepID=A0AA35Z871_LACSI|nr:unnamed protein product [Lactuca saligna]